MISMYKKISLKILDPTAKSSPCEKLLVVTAESELTFHNVIN